MRKWILSLMSAILPVAMQAQTFQQEFGNPRKVFVETVAMPNHADSHYAVGQQATLRVAAREGGVPLQGTMLRYKVGPEMLLPETYDSVAFVSGEATIAMGTMTEPGFLACQYEFKTADGKKQTDLVKLAFSPDAIESYTTMPKDFEQFWQKALKEARKVDFEPEYFDVPDATNKAFKTRLVRLHVGKNKWIYGMLTIPLTHRRGAGGETSFPVVLCPPGAGSTKVFPSDYFGREGMIYMKIEIHDNDPRLPDAEYNAMRQKKCEALQYFDVVNFARLLKVPTFMSWGYNDDTCSPTSVWAVWNVITAPKEKDNTPSSGHWRFPTSQTKCLEWMKQNLDRR